MAKKRMSDEAILEQFKKRREEAEDFWGAIHSDFSKAKHFVASEDGMWTADERNRMGEPAIQVNRLLPYVNLVVNAMIQQEIGCTVEPLSEGASSILALVRQAQLMTLWRLGHGLQAFAYAFREQVWGGYGVIKQSTCYSGRDGFNKTIKWEAIADPTCFSCDPSAKDPALADMCWAIEEHTLSKKGFQKLWGKMDKMDRKTADIFERGTKQIVYEYWVLHEAGYDEVMTDKGDTLEHSEYKKMKDDVRPSLQMQGDNPVMRRVSQNYVEQILIGNDRVLKRTPWEGSRLPYKVAEGRVVVENGRKTYQAMTTQAMSPQRKYNFIESQKTIMFSKGPQEIVFVPAEGTTTGISEKLNEAARNGSTNIVVIPYKSVSENGVPLPAPNFKAQLLGDPILTQEGQIAVQEIEACFGMSQNNWMQPSPSASGEAMKVRAAQGQTSNFDFNANALTMLEESFRDALEIIPMLSIAMQTKLGSSAGKDRVVWVNNALAAQKSGMENFDLEEDEEYSLVLKVAPSAETMRNQAFDQLMSFAKMFPQTVVAFPDLALKAGTNNIYTEQMAARIQKMVPKELLDDAPDPQVQALQGQLQQAQGVIQAQQEQLKHASSTIIAVQDQLKGEQAKKNTDTVLAMLDVQLKKLDVTIGQQDLMAATLKKQTEELKALNEQRKLMAPVDSVLG